MSTNANVLRGEQQHSSVHYWYLAALVVSLGVHGWGYVWSKSLPIRGLSESPAPALLPPKFVVRQVQFDPKSLQDAPEPAPAAKKEPPSPDKLVFSDAKPQAVDVKLDVKPVDLSNKLVEDKPKAQAETLAMSQLPQSTAGALDSELSALAGTFLKAPAVSNEQPVLAMNQQLAIWTLEKLGCSVDIAENGEVALKKIRNDVYDLILMDLQMPGMDGLTAAHEIRRIEVTEALKMTPIVAMTAHVLDEDRILAKKAGMQDFLIKPVSADEFQRVLSKFL
jgi:CheY-like chemotaxis protein